MRGRYPRSSGFDSLESACAVGVFIMGFDYLDTACATSSTSESCTGYYRYRRTSHLEHLEEQFRQLPGKYLSNYSQYIKVEHCEVQ